MRVRFALSVLVTTLAVGCSQSSDTSNATPTTTTAPTTTPTTENFTGTVPVGGADVKPFNILLANGQLNIILTAAGPPPTIQMGLGVGSYSGTTCTIFQGGSVITAAGATAQLAGTAISAGQYCVQVSDVGNQASPVTYAVTVIHF
ncbi:MAG: hypothetical protein HY048_10700 [Acidobacteria bacterium]|nr:hypothetical protein [Acidobacteriota bacterium]